MDVVDKMKAVLDDLKRLPRSRERALAIERLEECAFWTSLAMNKITSPIDHVADQPAFEVVPRRRPVPKS